MAAEVKKEIALEIAHVLFIDIVAYSKMASDDQRAAIEKLNQIVQSTDEFRKEESENRLLKLATGDGMALIFYHSPEDPVECALEISRAIKEGHSNLRLRMGVNSGPVSGVVDVNGRANVAGAGINTAQRVMDCGDAGHILLSKRVAEDLEQFKHWRPHLYHIGECEVKHGDKIEIVNLFTAELGNSEKPSRLSAAAKIRDALPPTRQRAKSPKPLAALGAMAAIVAVGVCAFLFWQQQKTKSSAAASAAPEKSIAVLPFANLSRDPDNAYFADGIQDEILTRLAKIADLKVISRTSTQHYKSAPENLPEIARQLGVAHIVEGSVQKSGDTVRVNVLLIKAANDSHLWADTFDRKLTDIFSVETEVATKIAETLQAKLTGAERNAIAARPTENTHAYQLYLKGRFFWNKRTGENLKKAADYFNQAIAADPNYALAYAGLAGVYVLMPFYSVGAPRDCYPRAKAAAKKALEQDDALTEAHTALAQVHCYYDFDFSQATSEFQRAIELNPNYATAHQWYGNSALVALGRFDEAIAEVKRAIELDPLSLVINTDLGATYYRARRYDEAIEQLHKTLELDPGFYYARWNLGSALSAKGAIGEAIGEYQKARALNDDPLVLGLLTRAYAFSGNKT